MEKVNSSSYVAIILDETQDVANVSQLIFYYKILVKGKPEVHYSGIHALPRGDVRNTPSNLENCNIRTHVTMHASTHAPVVTFNFNSRKNTQYLPPTA